jgi:hypothetical protein
MCSEGVFTDPLTTGIWGQTERDISVPRRNRSLATGTYVSEVMPPWQEES